VSATEEIDAPCSNGCLCLKKKSNMIGNAHLTKNKDLAKIQKEESHSSVVFIVINKKLIRQPDVFFQKTHNLSSLFPKCIQFLMQKA